MQISVTFSVTAVLVLGGMTFSEAATEPVCSYRSALEETVFLKYLPYLHKGEDYVDFGGDGKCVRRATCTERFKTEVEDCSKFGVTCANKKQFPGVFPACCVKC